MKIMEVRMGLFGFIKNASKGNFNLIPRNWTYVYYRLLQHHKDLFYPPSLTDPRKKIDAIGCIMMAASVINANEYFKRGQLTLEDLDMSFSHASTGKCGPVPSMPNQGFHDSPVSHGKRCHISLSEEVLSELMINYALQHTSVLLAIDNPRLTASDIIDACIHSKPTVISSIATLNDELARGKGNSTLTNVSVANIMLMEPSRFTTPLISELVYQDK